MMLGRLLAVGLWLGLTATATAIVWAGTSTVAADLTDRPPPVVAHQEVVTALETGAPEAKTDPGITTPSPGGLPSAPSDAGGSQAAGSDGSEPDAPSAEEAAPGDEPPAAVPPAAPTPPPADPTSPPTTLPPSGPTATYSTAGGVVTVACKDYFFTVLVSATPNNGYSVNVVNPGPYFVEVHFVRSGRDEPLWVYCLGQPIRAHGGGPWPGQFFGP